MTVFHFFKNRGRVSKSECCKYVFGGGCTLDHTKGAYIRLRQVPYSDGEGMPFPISFLLPHSAFPIFQKYIH